MSCPYTVPDERRFWSKVEIDTPQKCWRWIASVNSKGYGTIGWGARIVHAHRLMWELVMGPIPHGLDLLHSCDNPHCVNPHHLRPGTHRDNMRDMAERGRAGKPSKITSAQIADFRARLAAGETYRAIGRAHGIMHSTVTRALREDAR